MSEENKNNKNEDINQSSGTESFIEQLSKVVNIFKPLGMGDKEEVLTPDKFIDDSDSELVIQLKKQLADAEEKLSNLLSEQSEEISEPKEENKTETETETEAETIVPPVVPQGENLPKPLPEEFMDIYSSSPRLATEFLKKNKLDLIRGIE